MISLPLDVNYAELYFTFRCNLSCQYCINGLDVAQRMQPELAVGELADGINRIDFGAIPLTIGGGEPTQREDFYELLESIRPDIGLDLLTNLQFDVDQFMSLVKPERFNNYVDLLRKAYKSIRVSYHPQQVNAAELVQKVALLQSRGFRIGIFGISHPLNMNANIEMSELAREAQVYFFIKDFLGTYGGKTFGFYKYPEALNGGQRTCVCKTTELLIGSDGRIYRCHRDLYRSEYAVASILDADLQLHSEYRACDKFGECNACDVKWKVNRFLSMGKCSVDIRF